MASDDDDIERLLREVEGALGDGSPSRASPARRGGSQPSRSDAAAPGPVDRVRAGFPASIAVGAVAGGVVGVVFAVLPFVDSLSGALGAFLGATGVMMAGRLRRRR